MYAPFVKVHTLGFALEIDDYNFLAESPHPTYHLYRSATGVGNPDSHPGDWTLSSTGLFTAVVSNYWYVYYNYVGGDVGKYFISKSTFTEGTSPWSNVFLAMP